MSTRRLSGSACPDPLADASWPLIEPRTPPMESILLQRLGRRGGFVQRQPLPQRGLMQFLAIDRFSFPNPPSYPGRQFGSVFSVHTRHG